MCVHSGPPTDDAVPDPTMERRRTFLGPLVRASSAKTPAWPAADMGALSGHGNTRSVARIILAVFRGDTVDGIRRLSPETIDTIFEEQSNGVDLALGIPLSFGLGFALPQQESMP